MQERATDVGTLPSDRVPPRAALSPIAAHLLPQGGRGDTEARVGLGVAEVLVAAHGRQPVRMQDVGDPGTEGCDRKGVPVEEHEHVGGIRLGDDDVGELVQLLRVRPLEVGGEVETVPHARVVDAVQRGEDPVRDVDVPMQVVRLDIDPHGALPVHRHDVDHLRPRGGEGICRSGHPSPTTVKVYRRQDIPLRS